MNKTNEIEKLINQGRQQIEEYEKQKLQVMVNERAERFRAWALMIEKGKKILPSVVKNAFTVIDPEFMKCEPPKNLQDGDYWMLDIDDLAPIMVRFAKDDTYIFYRVPTILIDADNKRSDDIFGWSGYTKYGITGERDIPIYDTKDLSMALAEAQTRFKIKQELEEEYLLEQAEKANKADQPVYEDVDGSEPVPDQVLLNSLRQLVREEISKG